MKTSDFDYELPQSLIAQIPIEPRDASRLMVLDRQTGTIEHRHFRDIPDYLQPGDVLVCNESRVIPARLYGRKVPSGGKVELLLIAKRGENRWEALVRGRKVRVGTKIEIGGRGQGIGDKGLSPVPCVVAEVMGETEAGGRLIRFDRPIESLLDDLGVTPLPPYIHEPLSDAERYQTIYARVRGSVAAPTAGLHFTPRLVDEIGRKGVEFAFVVLHIGLDTFRPIREEKVEDHRIHTEYCQLSSAVADQLNRARAEGRRIIAVGTTSVRVLETAAQAGEQQADASVSSPTTLLAPYSGWTDLFIYPGYQFRAVDALLTNFHLPRSTLLLLVAAFAGKDTIDKAYQEAIRKKYRFYSFGDCMLIL
ncbi:MAG TPA: tRNA preQ1(34) S-adenosylmethionine ribosyltransferase-isomerase QueA [Anaerolineae bacterium]|nr:tRNA preQ1(34) S-adenosylmethionine ribosyltransferase-isomerase QueA [Anaerolineae bacterium]